MGIFNVGTSLVMVVAQHWSPPHYVMGYTFTEWLALLSILTIFVTAATWLIRVVIVAPLNAQISILSSKINDMNKEREKDTKSTTEMLSQQAQLLQDHERQLARHSEDIKTLFKQKDERK